MTDGRFHDGQDIRPVQPQTAPPDVFQHERQLTQVPGGDRVAENSSGPMDRIGRYVGEVAADTVNIFLAKDQLLPAHVRLIAANVDLINKANGWDEHNTEQVMIGLETCAGRQTNPACANALRNIAEHVGHSA